MEKKRIVALFLLILLLVPGALFAKAEPEGAKGPVVLKWPTIWVGADSKAAQVKALVDEFNAEYEGTYRVDIEENPDYDGYRDKLNAQMAAGVVPDLFVFNPGPTEFSFYEGEDLLFDFADALAGDWGNDFVGGSIADATINGETKSLPFEIAVTPIWYNMNIFDAAGVGIPETPAEFWAACDAIKAAGFVPTSQMTGGSNAWTSMLFFSHIAASIGGPNVWEKPLTDPVFVEAASILLKMYQDGNTTDDAVGGDAGVSGGHFLAGRTAMFINGPWYIGRVRDEVPDVYAATEVGSLAAFGSNEGAQIGFPLSNLAAGYTDDPAKKEAVIAFMKWMTKPEHVKRISMDSGSLFAVKYQTLASDDVDALQAKFTSATADASFVAKHFAAIYEADVVAEFGQALGAMVLGRATPEDFMQQIADLVK